MVDSIKNKHGEALDFHFLEGGSKKSELMVLGHGVTANKDRDWALALEAALSKQGYSVLRFSFAGNGTSEGDFGDSCPSKEADDLTAVLDHFHDFQVTYVGHSMGGCVGVLVAAKDSRIQRLISLAGMVHTKDFAARKFGELEPGQFMWDKPECPLSQSFLDDMNSIDSVQSLATEIQVPWLLVHGDADTVVPYSESEDIAAAATTKPAVVKITGADHLFSGDHTEMMCQAVLNWLTTQR